MIMRCPFCTSSDTQVKDSRSTDDDSAIRRRRVCTDCGGRFTTFERIQLRELLVVKKSGRRVPFDREKLERSVKVALRKRKVDEDRIDRLVSAIVRRLESAGEPEVESKHIGTIVMESLRQVDDVAYIRFASVYRDFGDASDFQEILAEISGPTEPLDEVDLISDIMSTMENLEPKEDDKKAARNN